MEKGEIKSVKKALTIPQLAPDTVCVKLVQTCRGMKAQDYWTNEDSSRVLGCVEPYCLTHRDAVCIHILYEHGLHNVSFFPLVSITFLSFHNSVFNQEEASIRISIKRYYCEYSQLISRNLLCNSFGCIHLLLSVKYLMPFCLQFSKFYTVCLLLNWYRNTLLHDCFRFLFCFNSQKAIYFNFSALQLFCLLCPMCIFYVFIFYPTKNFTTM